jgi:hypothetical protein
MVETGVGPRREGPRHGRDGVEPPRGGYRPGPLGRAGHRKCPRSGRTRPRGHRKCPRLGRGRVWTPMARVRAMVAPGLDLDRGGRAMVVTRFYPGCGRSAPCSHGVWTPVAPGPAMVATGVRPRSDRWLPPRRRPRERMRSGADPRDGVPPPGRPWRGPSRRGSTPSATRARTLATGFHPQRDHGADPRDGVPPPARPWRGPSRRGSTPSATMARSLATGFHPRAVAPDPRCGTLVASEVRMLQARCGTAASPSRRSQDP